MTVEQGPYGWRRENRRKAWPLYTCIVAVLISLSMGTNVRNIEFKECDSDTATAVPLVGIYELTESPLRCAFRCADDPVCTVFGYNAKEKLCSLFGRSNLSLDLDPNTNTDNDFSAPDWIFFRRPECIDGLFLREKNWCIKFTEQQKQYAYHRGYCKNDLGGKGLIEFTSVDELLYLQAALYYLPRQGKKSFYIGTKISSPKDDFKWTSNKKPVISELWEDKEPKKDAGVKSPICALLSANDLTTKLTTGACNDSDLVAICSVEL